MTRPTWLAPQDLEELLVEQNLQINITELRQNRNECKLTESLFAAIRQRLPEDRHTNEFELQYARILLAADVQRILIAWCEQGLKETMRVTMGKLGLPYDAVQAPEVDQAGHNGCMSSPDVFTAKYNTSGSGRILPQLCIPQKRVYHDSCSHTEERKTRKTYSPVTSTERDLRCPYHVMNPDEHRFECANRNYPNPRKLKYFPVRLAEDVFDANVLIGNIFGSLQSLSSALHAARDSVERRQKKSTSTNERSSAEKPNPHTKAALSYVATKLSSVRRIQRR